MSSYLHKKMGHTNEPEGDFEGSIGFLNWIALKFYMAKDYIYPAIEYQINVSPMVLLLEMGAIIFTVVFVYTIYKRVRRLRCSKTIQTQTEDVPTAQANDTPMEGQVPKNHTEDEPMAEDKPKIEGEPIAEDEPMAEDEPKVEDEPMVKDAPMVEDAPMSIEAETTPEELEKEKKAQMYDDLLLGVDDDDDKEMTAAIRGATDPEISSPLINRFYNLGRLGIDGLELPPVIIEMLKFQKTTQTRPVTGLYIEKRRPKQD